MSNLGWVTRAVGRERWELGVLARTFIALMRVVDRQYRQPFQALHPPDFPSLNGDAAHGAELEAAPAVCEDPAPLQDEEEDRIGLGVWLDLQPRLETDQRCREFRREPDVFLDRLIGQEFLL